MCHVVQAAGSWSADACCAVDGNDCCSDDPIYPCCWDRTSSSDWLFGLWPGPPQRFQPTGTWRPLGTDYQLVSADWPRWGHYGNDLRIGTDTSGAPPWPPGGSGGECDQGTIYRGTEGEICGGGANWGATDVEVWYPR